MRMYCANCGGQMSEQDVFCPECGAKNEELATTPEQNNGLKNKGIIGIAAVVLVAVIAGVALLLGSGVSGPVVKIGKAVKKTVEKENFTIIVEGEGDGEDIEGLIQVDCDFKEREIMMYMEMDSDGRKIVYAIYDEQVITGREYDGRMNYYSYDISDELDDMFDDYEDSAKEGLDWGELADRIDDAGVSVDDDEFETCAKRYFKLLNDESWLKENAGYSKSKKNGATIYSFEPDLYDFIKTTLDEFEDALDDYSDIRDDLRDEKSDFNDIEMKISIGVKSGRLSSVEIEGEYDGEDASMLFEFDDIGKTTIDTDELEDMLDEAED